MPGDRAVADFCGKLSKWQVFRVVGIHFWLRMVKIPEIRLTNPNIYRITYIWEQFRRECGTRAPARSCRRNHGLVLVPCTWFGADGKYRLI